MTPEELTEAERRMRPDFVATVPRGKPMTREQANGLSSNPRFYDKDSFEKGYWNNCQSCVVSYIMRLRGYDVEAKPRELNNDAQEEVALNTAMAWINPQSIKHPSPTIIPAKNAKNGLKWIKQNVEEGGIYTFEFRSLDPTGYFTHVIIIEKNEGSLIFYDPQSGIVNNSSTEIRFMKSIAWNVHFKPKIMRVDLLEPNMDIIDRILKPKVKNDTDD